MTIMLTDVPEMLRQSEACTQVLISDICAAGYLKIGNVMPSSSTETVETVFCPRGAGDGEVGGSGDEVGGACIGVVERVAEEG